MRCATSRLAVSSARLRAAAWSSSPASLRAAVGLAPALRRLVQRLERQRQTAACSLDRIGFAHAPTRLSQRAQKLCDGNHLRKEAYVASS
jgi:hypothetical protein